MYFSVVYVFISVMLWIYTSCYTCSTTGLSWVIVTVLIRNMLSVYDVHANYKIDSQNDDEFKNTLFMKCIFFRTTR